jgi:hypothetical protein
MPNIDSTKGMILIALIVGLAVTAVTIGLSRKRQAQSKKQSQANQLGAARHVSDKLSLLDGKARSAKSGNQDDVLSLTDEVLNFFGTPETVQTLWPFRERLVRAEADYRKKHVGGMKEEKLAHAVNRFAHDLGAPDYAYVNDRQIRYLRAHFEVALPHFIGATRDSKDRVVMNPEMSPLEAVALTHLLITQKLSNPSFQVSPQEWMETQHQERLTRRNSLHEEPLAESESSLTQFTESEKTKTLKQMFTKSSADLQTLIDHYLIDLGLPN